MSEPTIEQLVREKEALEARLEEAEEALRALRAGEVDAVVVSQDSESVYTLERPEQHYRLVIEQMPHAAATLTEDGRILHANRLLAALLDRPLSAVHGRPLQSFVDPRGRAALESLLRGCGEDATQGEVELRKAGGPGKTLHVRLSTLRGGALGACILLEDMTAQRYVQELEHAQEALREADRKKDAFLATLAHELRNPLAPIKNAVELLKLESASPDVLCWSRGVLDRQVQIMARLLEDLLDVSRISQGKLELRRESVDLAAVLESALETSRPTFEAAGHHLEVDLPGEPIPLEADPVRLAQVFSNLLNNAAKYTEAGGRTRVSARAEDNDVVVTVEDTGIGIHPDMLPHLFEIFSQAEPAMKRAQGGLGIGLSLAKGIVDRHGGSIEARSDGPGRGSAFVVRLPRSRALRAPNPPFSAPAASAPAGARVLVADDNRDSAESLAMVLRRMGAQVQSVPDGLEAVRVAETWRPHVALLDLGMPGLDGYDACRRIRAAPWGGSMRLIALTGWGQEEDRRRAAEAGFDEHLVKPVGPQVLAEVLGAVSVDGG